MDKVKLEKFLYFNPDRFKHLSMLMGLAYMYKVLDCNDFEDFVNKYKIYPKHYHRLIDELTFDTSLDQLLEGELLEIQLNLRMWFKEEKPNWDNVIFRGRDLLK